MRFCSTCGRPRLLDAFSGAGGAGVGYHRAGFCVTGVDLAPQPRYPFAFHQGDALEYLAEHGHEYAAVHASPPCQDSSALTRGNRRREGWTDDHVDLIVPTRAALARLDAPTVIENVQGAQVRRDVTLCGDMFDLAVIRHRYFELEGFSAAQPPHPYGPRHRGRVTGWRHGVWYPGPYFAVYGEGGGKGSVPEWQAAMGIDWTDVRLEIAEAIPPAYTRYLGAYLLGAVEARGLLSRGALASA